MAKPIILTILDCIKIIKVNGLIGIMIEANFQYINQLFRTIFFFNFRSEVTQIGVKAIPMVQMDVRFLIPMMELHWSGKHIVVIRIRLAWLWFFVKPGLVIRLALFVVQIVICLGL